MQGVSELEIGKRERHRGEQSFPGKGFFVY